MRLLGVAGRIEHEALKILGNVVDPAATPRAYHRPAERDRRERAGEKQTGVVAFAADPGLTLATSVGERLLVADLVGDDVLELATAGPAFDPRPDPTRRRVAYVTGGALHVIDLATGRRRRVGGRSRARRPPGAGGVRRGGGDGPVPGLPVVARRGTGAAARVDERAVRTWWVTSPVDPAAAPRAVLPDRPTANADVSLHVIDMEGARVDVAWDRLRFEYVASVDGPPRARRWSWRSPAINATSGCGDRRRHRRHHGAARRP